MRRFSKGLLAATAGVAVFGVASLAAAGMQHTHQLSLRLPDGSVEQIAYTGDVAPRIVVADGPAPLAVMAPSAASLGADPFGPDSPFAELQRVSAALDREAALMMQAQPGLPMPMLTGDGQGLMRVDLGALPKGVQGYSVVSTSVGDAVCTRSTEVISRGDGQAPKVVTHASGQCGADGHDRQAPAAAAPPASSAGDGSRLIQASYALPRA
jgi:hypothetical protein